MNPAWAETVAFWVECHECGKIMAPGEPIVTFGGEPYHEDCGYTGPRRTFSDDCYFQRHHACTPPARDVCGCICHLDDKEEAPR